MYVGMGQRALSFFNFFRGVPRTTEEWERRLEWRANRYGLGDTEEVRELRSNIRDKIESGDVEYLVKQVDPTLRTWRLSETTLAYSEPPPYEVPVLRASTVLSWHFPGIHDDLTKIVVDGKMIDFYAGKRKLVTYFATKTIPAALVKERQVLVVQLISGYTGIRPSVDQLMRMNKAVFQRTDQDWSFTIQRKSKPG